MEYALVLAIFLIGAVAGALITIILLSDRIQPRLAEVHSYGDDIEQRSRRVQ